MRHAEIMASVIDFDAQLGRVTIKIEDVWTCRVLTAEVMPGLLPPKRAPQQPLG